jgi:predicted SprT family Zn-dependent metalloprotease
MKTSYAVCALDTADAYRIDFLKEHWHYFNKHLFGGLLREPTFSLSNKKRNLGTWYKDQRMIEIAKRMFKQPKSTQLLGTLVHEMAHQYDDEILHTRDSDVHGQSWQHIMASIGLTTDAKYMGPPLKTVDKIQQEEQHRRILDNNAQIDPYSFKTDKYLVLRFVSPSQGVDTPIVIEPSHELPVKYFYGWKVRKDGTLDGQRKMFNVSFVVVPGPLKIRTPLYREAQKRADELNQ